MGLAIDESVKDSELSDKYDDVVLSPAHQIVITCIWISLKVILTMFVKYLAILYI